MRHNSYHILKNEYPINVLCQQHTVYLAWNKSNFQWNDDNWAKNCSFKYINLTNTKRQLQTKAVRDSNYNQIFSCYLLYPSFLIYPLISMKNY